MNSDCRLTPRWRRESRQINPDQIASFQCREGRISGGILQPNQPTLTTLSVDDRGASLSLSTGGRGREDPAPGERLVRALQPLGRFRQQRERMESGCRAHFICRVASRARSMATVSASTPASLAAFTSMSCNLPLSRGGAPSLGEADLPAADLIIEAFHDAIAGA